MTGSMFAVTGDIGTLTPDERSLLCDRGLAASSGVRETVAAILSRVRRGGDGALRELARELDGVTLEALEVPREELSAALDALDLDTVRALERARDNIARAHTAWMPVTVEVETEPGVVVGRRADPLSCVGVYAPGGRAVYPSSVLMGVVPARVAGVGEVIVCSPPQPNGLPAPAVLAAAALAGAGRVFSLGGAGAVAAMAFGTESVPRVDRIVGPGNTYVSEAKTQVAGIVGIDSPAGPSELLVIFDGSAAATTVACEMVAQAEHDPDAAVVAVLLPGASRQALEAALRARLECEPRAGIARQAFAGRGAVLQARSASEALSFAAAWAPEHLLLAVEDPEAMLPLVRNAGTIFLGETASVAFGDYLTGANHVLPTSGAARSYSGLSTLDFMRWTTYQRVSRAAASSIAGATATLADAEGLPAHASAARAWQKNGVQ
ncbi:MAG TPA: histidinol dehydrogenase [Gemmatimonadaceae bacterium]|nr:histidinol dehydrogenase [Gemmatimonadaceae bacterium]